MENELSFKMIYYLLIQYSEIAEILKVIYTMNLCCIH